MIERLGTVFRRVDSARIPYWTYKLLKDGKLSATDLLIILHLDGVITSFSDEENGDLDRAYEVPCDAYVASTIAHFTNRGVDDVERSIRNLIELGQVIAVKLENGETYLELEWARLPHQWSRQMNAYNRAHAQARALLEKKGANNP